MSLMHKVAGDQSQLHSRQHTHLCDHDPNHILRNGTIASAKGLTQRGEDAKFHKTSTRRWRAHKTLPPVFSVSLNLPDPLIPH